MSDDRPIGFFDSGLGGLTVLKAVRARFPQENLVYLGDTARLPYGTKSPQTIRRYTEQNIAALQKLNVKAIVVACNSASTSILGGDRKTIAGLPVDFPIFNVIEPGAEAAHKASTERRIGVLGTKATVLSQAYAKSLHAIDAKVQVFQQPAPLLVPLVEEGWEEDPLTNLVIYRYLAPLIANRIDTLILGCTHYPVLKAGIARVAGGAVHLVDSAEAIADQLREAKASGRLNPHNPAEGSKGRLELLATDTSPSMNEAAQRLLRTADAPSENIAFKAFDL